VPLRPAIALLAAAALLVLAGVAWDRGLLRPPPRLERTPEAIARGRAFIRTRCQNCHEMIALPARVAGWSARRAYDTVGRLPQVNPAMPIFPGSEADRRDVAVYLSALGAGEAPPP
jgi:mono/diheme cytochrome c family protein